MKKHRLILLTLAFSAIFLSACTGASGRLTASSWPGITATEDTLYVAYGPHVYALDAANGSQQWIYPAEPDNNISFYSKPGLSEDGTQLVFGGYDSVLYSINPDNGLSSGWSFTGATNRYISDVLLTSDGIFAPNSDGSVYAIDYSGTPLWGGKSYTTDKPFWAGSVSDGSTLFAASLDHKIHAVELASGRMLWTQDLETAIAGSPALDDGYVYAGTFGSKVYALDATSGRVAWTFETNDWVWASPAISDGMVFIGDVAGNFYALDAKTGVSKWSFTAEGGIYGGALVVDGSVYFGTEDGKFYALSTEGQSDWFYSLNGKIYGTPVFNGEYLFVASIEGDVLVTALDLAGVARWPFSLEN